MPDGACAVAVPNPPTDIGRTLRDADLARAAAPVTGAASSAVDECAPADHAASTASSRVVAVRRRWAAAPVTRALASASAPT